MIIDLHSHYFPLSAVERLPSGSVAVSKQTDGSYRFEAGGHVFPLATGLIDLETQISDLQRRGLDQRTLMVPPFTVLYELPAAEGVRWSQALNDGIAEAVAAHPEALVGFATVPLQDVAAAVTELERARGELGLQGVEILTSINGVGLDTPELDPFWAAAEQLEVPILIHPHYVAGADRMGAYHLRNLVGNPAETALAGGRLLFGGVLERFPRLRIILSHGGGALPHLIGRLRQGFRVRPECQERAHDPIAALKRLYYDTVVFDATVLRHVVELVGAEQVVLGTDYPFDMSEDDPVGFVRGSGLSGATVDAILHAGDRLIPAGSEQG